MPGGQSSATRALTAGRWTVLLREAGTLLWKVAALACIVYLTAFYGRLGYVLPIVYTVGVVVAVVVAGRGSGSSYHVGRSAATALGYTVVQAVVFAVATGESEERFAMTWSEDSVPDGTTSAVTLEFEAFPGNYIKIYSRDVLAYLQSIGRRSVDVSFVVTRDIGCLRGYHETKIGALTSWRTSSGGHAGRSGDSPTPWRDPWWCP